MTIILNGNLMIFGEVHHQRFPPGGRVTIIVCGRLSVWPNPEEIAEYWGRNDTITLFDDVYCTAMWKKFG